MSLKSKKLHPHAFLHFKDADGNPMFADAADGTPDTTRPMGANLFGPGSKEYIRAKEEFDAETFSALQKGTLKSNQPSFEQKVKFVSACTHSWVNVDVPDESTKPTEPGAPPPMLAGEELTATIWPDPAFIFLLEQAEVFVVKSRNFTAKPATA